MRCQRYASQARPSRVKCAWGATMRFAEERQLADVDARVAIVYGYRLCWIQWPHVGANGYCVARPGHAITLVTGSERSHRAAALRADGRKGQLHATAYSLCHPVASCCVASHSGSFQQSTSRAATQQLHDRGRRPPHRRQRDHTGERRQCDRRPWQEKFYCRALPCLSSVL